MNKISNLALEISQDIYAISSEVDTANHDMHNFKITPCDYSNKLYIAACKAFYMKQVIEVVRNHGYKFRNYEKEMELLNSIINIVYEDLNVSVLTSLASAHDPVGQKL